ncbi:DEAD/DEAH box helicase [Providencia manganoxydans]|uniref:DEAD/DEAH box helicase n=4 Tax=Gammaproteobacteria TaxID=1236 RepID=UPI002DB8FA90|nr:ATP-binding domain-containing protein [Escherichia coli]MEC4156434.1 ATP-binding domain-containing protein [Escherichia coli]
MSGYCFYSDDALELIKDKPIKVAIDEYAENNKKQTYVICRPLSKDDSTYDYSNAISIFSAGIRPFFVDLGGDDKSFSEYCDDFIEDVSFLAEKYKYRDKIGRKKAWEHLFVPLSDGDFDFQSYSLEKKESRVVELIISLIVGSINDVSKINLETNNLLDSVKSKIILFDTDQTSFVFKSNIGKRYVVQGLAGSGKTELLLHKLKEVYSNNDDVRIAFTCFNKILSRSMRKRIPEFFDFMRVEKQIDWDNKLFCFNSWGLSKEPKSGMYRYICDYYKIPFGNMYNGTFDELCKRAKKEILEKGIAEDKAFDYVFIDESQDFTDSFIELCELVTSKKVYVAGDVFQNIFRPIDDNVNRADMVLKKCYRTDPKNLMFSHALGMGLYEKPVLRWLKHSEWESCGYKYEEVDDGVSLSRDPLRRFEDIPSEYKSTSIHLVGDEENISSKIVEIICKIRDENPTIEQSDIAVIFVDTDKYIYEEIPLLKYKIQKELGWESTIAFESKNKDNGKLFLSNINNAKGLEFPFVICFAKSLKKVPSFRNALYTMMARSFLESHLVLSNDTDMEVLGEVKKGLDFLMRENYMKLRIPSAEEISKQKDYIVLDEPLSISSLVKNYCKDKKASPRLIAKIIDRVTRVIADDDYESDYIIGLIELEYERNKVL